MATEQEIETCLQGIWDKETSAVLARIDVSFICLLSLARTLLSARDKRLRQ